MIWYDMIWYDMIWYDMKWYDINGHATGTDENWRYLPYDIIYVWPIFEAYVRDTLHFRILKFSLNDGYSWSWIFHCQSVDYPRECFHQSALNTRLLVDIYVSSLPVRLFAVDGFAAMLSIVRHYFPKLPFGGVPSGKQRENHHFQLLIGKLTINGYFQ